MPHTFLGLSEVNAMLARSALNELLNLLTGGLLTCPLQLAGLSVQRAGGGAERGLHAASSAWRQTKGQLA